MLCNDFETDGNFSNIPYLCCRHSSSGVRALLSKRMLHLHGSMLGLSTSQASLPHNRGLWLEDLAMAPDMSRGMSAKARP